MLEQHASAVVQVMCDLRRLHTTIDDVRGIEYLWRKINNRLIGRSLVPGEPLKISLDGGLVALWIIDAQGQAHVTPETRFHIVDVVRNPALVYRCSVCRKYGPFRCLRCEKDGRVEGSERLCVEHAHFIRGRPGAYCRDHIPSCTCTSTCAKQATFACERCNKLFGDEDDHFRRKHPKDSTIEYCTHCYYVLFGLCLRCQMKGKPDTLGRLRCTFKTREMLRPCGMPLCWEHSFQWKIWGPHNRGLTFCEQHQQLVHNADPKDVLAMMIVAHPPQRGKVFSLANAFRLRRLLNRNRTEQLSFEQVKQALAAISYLSTTKEPHVRKRYSEIIQAFDKAVESVPQLQVKLTEEIRAFYLHTVGPETASRIVGVTIVDRFVSPGQADRWHIELALRSTEKRPYIGREGAVIKQLKAQFHISRLDFWDATRHCYID
jgi:hypothetical protein